MSSTGGVDTGIYGALQGPGDTIGLIGKVANINSQLNQNMQFQQQFEARKAMGPILQQSIGEDGQVDYGKAALAMAKNPATAWLAPDFMTQAVQRQGNQLDNQLKQWNIEHNLEQSFAGAAAGVLPLGDSVDRGAVAKHITNLYANLDAAGLGGPKMQDRLISFMAQLPTDGAPLASYMKQVAEQHAGAADSLGRVLGSFQQIDTGPNITLGYSSPFGGPDGRTPQFKAIGTIAKAPTVGEMNAPVDVQDASGAHRQLPTVQAQPMVNGTGAVINAGRAAAPGAGGGGAPLTKLDPGTQAFIEGQGKNMVDYSQKLNQASQDLQTQLQMVQNLRDLSHQFKPGAGGHLKTEMGSVLQALGVPQEAVDKVANGSLSASQAFAKYSTQNTMNVLRQAIGGQGRLTNLEFDAFLKANPNLDTDPRAIDKILAMTQQVMKLKMAEQQGFDAWNHAGHAPQDFPAAWSRKLIDRGIIRTAEPARAP